MAQLTLKHCCIADVIVDDTPNGCGKVVKLNVNEEDLYEMLDNINPKVIIKYLDMRNIHHRDSLNVNLYVKNPDQSGSQLVLTRRNRKKVERIVQIAQNINNSKHE